jgi:hypothetical protein
MHDGDPERPFLIVAVPDSPDARLFVELSSFGADLSQARRALGLAMDDTKDEVREFLLGFAVVAYCRTVLPSNVRGRLTDHVGIPDGLLDVHDQVRSFRNGTIAHSQSDLAVTYPFGVLDSLTLDVCDVTAATMSSSLPRLVVARFETLVEVMEALVDAAIEPVRSRLRHALGQVDPQHLIAADRPRVVERLEHEFDPRTRRRPYPSSHTVYWQANEGLADAH